MTFHFMMRRSMTYAFSAIGKKGMHDLMSN